MTKHPFDFFAAGHVEPEPAPPLLAALRDATRHEDRGHLVTAEAIIEALDGMSVDVDVEAREQIKRRLIEQGWAATAVDTLFADPRWRAALAGIEAAYAVALEAARATARQAAKEARHG
jgi:secreted protein with Ig-like and vWFA domain